LTYFCSFLLIFRSFFIVFAHFSLIFAHFWVIFAHFSLIFARFPPFSWLIPIFFTVYFCSYSTHVRAPFPPKHAQLLAMLVRGSGRLR
jgi:hypothetical protein